MGLLTTGFHPNPFKPRLASACADLPDPTQTAPQTPLDPSASPVPRPMPGAPNASTSCAGPRRLGEAGGLVEPPGHALLLGICLVIVVVCGRVGLGVERWDGLNLNVYIFFQAQDATI